MVNFVLKFVSTVLIIYMFGALAPQVTIGSLPSLIVFLIFLGVLNGLVLPLIKLISFPINFLTLGLFNVVLNLIGLSVAVQTISNAIIIQSTGIGYIVTLVILSFVLSIPSYFFDNDN